MDVIVLGKNGLRPTPVRDLSLEKGQILVWMHLHDGLDAIELSGGVDVCPVEGLLLLVGEEARHVLGDEDNDGGGRVEVEVPRHVLAKHCGWNEASSVGAWIPHDRDTITLDILLLADELALQVGTDHEQSIRHVKKLIVVPTLQQRAGEHEYRYASGVSGQGQRAFRVPAVAGDDDRRGLQRVQGPRGRLEHESWHKKAPRHRVAEQRGG